MSERPTTSARRSVFRRLLRIGFWTFLLVVVIGLGATAGLVIGLFRDLPSLEGLEDYQPSIATTLYSDSDEPFHSFYEQRRTLVPLAKVPVQLKQAILAVEDAHFYEHRGLSLRGIVRAFVMNLISGRKLQGGSTITQQLARGLFLTPEKNLTRKVKEALLSLEIERHYSKDKILELYCNLVYFGHGAYGVEAAAQTYFQKSVTDLTLPEAAMIAGLPSAPNRFSPIGDQARARRRREHVLGRMLDQQYITEPQLEQANRSPFNEALFTRKSSVAPYFVEHIRQILEETYGAYALYNTGLKVYTTLNLPMQRAAEEALVGGIRELDKSRGFRSPKKEPARMRVGPYTPRPGEIVSATVLKAKGKALEVQLGRYKGEIPFESLAWTKLTQPAANFPEGSQILVQILSVDEAHKIVQLALEQEPELEGALVAINPHDGSIKALIGGYNFERSKFNRATQAKRQPGSAFKPFVYGAAFDRGLTPSTVIEDSPISFRTHVGGKIVEWAPENFDRKFHGPMTLRRALENSINVVTVKLIQRIGVDAVIKLAHQVGIESELRREIALALGVSEVTPLELVSAYGVFANGGVRNEPFAIRKVTDSQGRILEQHLPDPQEVMRPETAYVLVNVMKGVIERGTGARAKVLERPLAGKTGTSSDAGDVWFVGFSPSLVAGVWLGYDQRRSLGGHAATGGALALPIWIQFMQKALAGTEREDFPVPDNVVSLPVNLMTGRPAPDERGTVLEYYVGGTEPKKTAAPSVTRPEQSKPEPVGPSDVPAFVPSPPTPAIPPASDLSTGR